MFYNRNESIYVRKDTRLYKINKLQYNKLTRNEIPIYYYDNTLLRLFK